MSRIQYLIVRLFPNSASKVFDVFYTVFPTGMPTSAELCWLLKKRVLWRSRFVFILVVRSKMLYKYGASQVQNLVTVRRKSSKLFCPKMRQYISNNKSKLNRYGVYIIYVFTLCIYFYTVYVSAQIIVTTHILTHHCLHSVPIFVHPLF
jgi:hypothetical protein